MVEMSSQEIHSYTKGITARDLYTSATSSAAFFVDRAKEAIDFQQSTTKIRGMRVRAEEWLSICDSLRPQHYEGPNN